MIPSVISCVYVHSGMCSRVQCIILCRPIDMVNFNMHIYEQKVPSAIQITLSWALQMCNMCIEREGRCYPWREINVYNIVLVHLYVMGAEKQSWNIHILPVHSISLNA